jgi:hypothetical protein
MRGHDHDATGLSELAKAIRQQSGRLIVQTGERFVEQD